MTTPHTPGAAVAQAVNVTLGGTQAKYHAVGIDGTNVAVAITGLVDADDGAINEANARRIAACWNACEGIPTEELEPSEYGQHIIDTGLEIGKLTAQRDALLEALTRIDSLSMSQFRSHQDLAAECQEIAFVAVSKNNGVPT